MLMSWGIFVGSLGIWDIVIFVEWWRMNSCGENVTCNVWMSNESDVLDIG